MVSVYNNLSKIDVGGHIEKKNDLNYLSWAWAWDVFKKNCPDARYEIWRDEQGRPYIYDEDLGYMVFVTVYADGESHMMWLPVMDGANKAMKSKPYTYYVKNKSFKYAQFDANRNAYFDKYGNEQKEYIEKTVEAATMFDINTAIMRCMVKCIGMFGLGLYIYAGEDLPKIMATDPIDKIKVRALEEMCKRLKIKVEDVCKLYGVTEMTELTEGQFAYISQHEQEIVNAINGGQK